MGANQYARQQTVAIKRMYVYIMIMSQYEEADKFISHFLDPGEPTGHLKDSL